MFYISETVVPYASGITDFFFSQTRKTFCLLVAAVTHSVRKVVLLRRKIEHVFRDYKRGCINECAAEMGHASVNTTLKVDQMLCREPR